MFQKIFKRETQQSDSFESTLQKADGVNLVKLFSYKDLQIGTFGALFEARHERDIREACVLLFRDEKAKENHLVKYADKFALYEHGTLDKDSGKITGLMSPKKCFLMEDIKNS